MNTADRARMLIDAGRPEDALGLLFSTLATNPDDVDLLCLVASAYLWSPSSEESLLGATAAAARAVELAPDDEWALRLLSSASSLAGDHDRSITAALSAQRMAPDNWQGHVRVVHSDIAASRASRRTDAALAEARRIAPEEPEVFFAAGRLAMSRKRWRLAEREYGRVLELAPDHPGARNNLALVQLRTMRAGDAAAGFVGLLRQDPTSQLALHNLRGTAEMALRIINLVLWLGLVAITSSYRMVTASPYPSTDSGQPSSVLLLIVAATATIVIAVYVLWVRYRSAGNFGRFVRSVPHTDRLLTVWAAVLVASLAALWVAILVPTQAARILCSTSGVILFAFLVVVVVRARRRPGT